MGSQAGSTQRAPTRTERSVAIKNPRFFKQETAEMSPPAPCDPQHSSKTQHVLGANMSARGAGCAEGFTRPGCVYLRGGRSLGAAQAFDSGAERWNKPTCSRPIAIQMLPCKYLTLYPTNKIEKKCSDWRLQGITQRRLRCRFKNTSCFLDKA